MAKTRKKIDGEAAAELENPPSPPPPSGEGEAECMLAGWEERVRSPVPVVVENPLRRPEGIAVDHDGNLWVADYGHDRLAKLSADGHLLLTIGTRGSSAGEFVGPKGVAVDPSSGKIYVADTGNARVQRDFPFVRARRTYGSITGR